MNTPLFALHKALVAELKRIGYSTVGIPTAAKSVVIIDQIRLTNPTAVKCAQDYEVTFVLDAVTRSQSPEQSYRVIENVRAELQVIIPNYTTQKLTFEECQTLQESDEQGLLWRQAQRIRILLTQKL